MEWLRNTIPMEIMNRSTSEASQYQGKLDNQVVHGIVLKTMQRGRIVVFEGNDDNKWPHHKCARLMVTRSARAHKTKVKGKYCKDFSMAE